MKITKQMLHEMIEETLNEVSNPEFQQGYMDGMAAGRAMYDSDPDQQIKNADPIHWETIDAEAPEPGSYREGFIMGYGSIWMGIHGTRISMPVDPPMPTARDFKTSPPVNRDPSKWDY